MADRCEFEDCKLEPEFICQCRPSLHYLCKRHLDVHTSEGLDHKIIKNSIQLDEDDKAILTAQCRICIKKLKELSIFLCEKSRNIVREIVATTSGCLESISTHEELCQKVLWHLDKSYKIVKKANYSQVESFILKFISSPDKVQELVAEKEKEITEKTSFDEIFCRSYKESLDLSMKLKDEAMAALKSETITLQGSLLRIPELESALKLQAFNISELKLLHADTISPSPVRSAFLYSFENNTKNICKIDPMSLKDSKFSLPVKEPLATHGGFCELYSNRYFYYGGYPNGKYINSVYIINTDNMTVSQKKPSKPKKYQGNCAYCKGKVFVFGGIGILGVQLTECEVYDIVEDSWRDIAELPQGLQLSTMAVCGNEICLSGYGVNVVFMYNIANNAFRRVAEVNGNGNKVIVKAGERVYIFEEGKLYESNDLACARFEIINQKTDVQRNALRGGVVIIGEFVYFVLTGDSIYRFGIVSKEIVKLRDVSF